MRSFGGLVLAFSLVLSSVSPGLAGVATIEATAPLQDHSQESIKAAFIEALKAAVGQAEAMGLPWVAINEVQILEHKVTIQLLATDTDPESEEGQGRERDRAERTAFGSPARLDL